MKALVTCLLITFLLFGCSKDIEEKFNQDLDSTFKIHGNISSNLEAKYFEETEIELMLYWELRTKAKTGYWETGVKTEKIPIDTFIVNCNKNGEYYFESNLRGSYGYSTRNIYFQIISIKNPYFMELSELQTINLPSKLNFAFDNIYNFSLIPSSFVKFIEVDNPDLDLHGFSIYWPPQDDLKFQTIPDYEDQNAQFNFSSSKTFGIHIIYPDSSAVDSIYGIQGDSMIVAYEI